MHVAGCFNRFNRCGSQSLDPIIAEANKDGKITSTWNLTLIDGEMSILDALVSQIELLRQNQDLRAEQTRLMNEQVRLKKKDG